MNRKISVILRGYKILHGLIPGYLPLAALRSVFSAAFPFINIIASAMIINAIVDRQPFEHVLSLAIWAAFINFWAQVIMHLLKRTTSYLSANMNWIYEKPLNEKQQEMDFEQIENSELRLMREKMAIYKTIQGKGIVRLFSLFEVMVSNFLTVVFSVSVFVPVFSSTGNTDVFFRFINTPWFVVFFLLMILGNAILSVVLTMKRTSKGTTVVSGLHFPESVGNFLKERLFSKYQAGKDIKVNQMQDCIEEMLYSIDNGVTFPVIKKYIALEFKYYSLGDISANILSIVVYIFVAVKALWGHFGVGNIIQYIGGIMRFNIGFAGLATNIAELVVNVEALDLYFEFLDEPTKIHHGTLPVEKRSDTEFEIEFRNVSFKYPGTDIYVLKNLNLNLNTIRRMAVVGMNGSGKTTMIKLLCRLYDPTEGEVTLNGIDIQKYNFQEYMNLFSVVFQDFKLFSFPIGQNVAASINYDAEKVKECLTKAGISERVITMPKHLDTPLYKDFDEDGVEISGGEAQKIAIARALYKEAPFIILDEPTAALDPTAEYEIYSKLNEIAKNKKAIFISHRLSSCRFCDDIAVFHEGKLIQYGGHDELIANEDGKYYELWNAQAQYYV